MSPPRFTHALLTATVASALALSTLFSPARARAQERLAPSTSAGASDPAIVASTLSSTLPLAPSPLASAPVAGVDPGASAVVVALAPWEATWSGVTISATAGAMRDPSGVGLTWTRATATRDVGAARFTTTVRATHALAAGRDPLDVMVIASATYRVQGPVRAGIEYVGQDVEAGLDGDGDGGMRHFLGPIIAIDLPRRFALVFGPAVSIAPPAPLSPTTSAQTPIVARLGVGYSF
jgi:hypothetical protein